MTSYYEIGGYILEIKREDLGNTPGFSLFQTDKHLCDDPILSIEFNTEVRYKDIELLHQFEGEIGLSKFYKKEDFYLFSTEDVNKNIWHIKIARENGKFIAYSNMNKNTNSYILRFSIWVAFAIAVLHRKTVPIHASAVTLNEKSILFLGESGTGKSTQSRNWLKYIPSTELLNDDSPFVTINESDEIVVCGSPWSGKTNCYKNKQTSIAAFVRLQQAPHNKLRRLRTIEAIGALQPSLPTMFATDLFLSSLMLDCLSLILKDVPVYSLECLPNQAAVDLVYTTLKKNGWL